MTRRENARDDDRVSPTARWIARGVWKFFFVLVTTLLVMGLIGLVVRAAFGDT
jgi:hypothetical protein